MRRKARIEAKLEKLAVSDSSRSIQYAEVVVLLLDAQIPFEKQDLALADLVEREGRAMVIAVNKWDTIEDKNEKPGRAARAVRALPAAAQGHPAGHHLGSAGPQYRQADAGDLRGGAALERPCVDGQAQPLARRDDRDPSATGRIRAPPEAALHDAGQDPAAQLHHFRFAPRRSCPRPISAIWSTACARPSICRARRSGCGCAAARTCSTRRTTEPKRRCGALRPSRSPLYSAPSRATRC